MDFAIIGAGSVGGYFGARLQQAGESVTFLVRPQRRDALLRDGLRVSSPLGDAALNVKAETEAGRIARCDVVVVAVRNFDLDGVMGMVGDLAGRGASVVSLLNGVEHIEKIRKTVDDGKIIGGSAYIDSRLGPNGEIIHRSQTPTIALGGIRGSAQGTLQTAAAAFARAGIKTRVMEDLLEGLWQKYLFVMLGSFTAVAGAPVGAVLANPWCASTLRAVLGELVAVARSVGVDLGERHAGLAMEELGRQKGGWTSLVYEDIAKRRRTETDSLWGYVVRKAEENSVRAPLSTACLGILKVKEASSGTA